MSPFARAFPNQLYWQLVSHKRASNLGKFPPLARGRRWFVDLLAICVLSLGCASTESSVTPLGFGSRAKQELAAQEKAHTQRAALVDYKGSRQTAPLGLQSHSATAIAATVEPKSRAATVDSPLPASSASVSAMASAAAKVSDWVGLWRGNDTTRYQIPNFPSQPMDDPNARIRIEISTGNRINLILIDSSNDRDLCTLAAEVEGTRAKVDPGQSCFGSEDDEGSMSARVKYGLGVMHDETFGLDLTLDASIQSEQFEATGTVDYHFEGKKLSPGSAS